MAMKLNMTLDKASDIVWEMHSLDGSVALVTFEKYVNGAIIQWNRIQVDKKALPGRGPGVNHTLMLTLFLDVHFYFVCIDKAQNLLGYIAEIEEDTKLEALWKGLKPKFKPFNDARNHLEHIESRIKKENLSDFGNLHNDSFTFGGNTFDISVSGLQMLKDAYEQMLTILSSRPKVGYSRSI